ncbi:MAG: DUF6602 domain-containing protein [Bacilli bacterium]|jgi:hypothetical protein
MKKNQKSNDSRQEYEEKQLNNNINQYFIDLGSTFNSTVNRLSRIIGSKNFLSVGEYKERLLRKEIEKFLPSNYSIGTGFVVFPKFEIKDETPIYSHDISKQLDIIIYDNTKIPTIFRDESFIVITPEQVVAIIEVKGVNSNKQNPIDVYKDFYDKWLDYCVLKGKDIIAARNSGYKLEPPTFFCYIFDEYVSKNGEVFGEEKGFDYVFDSLKEFVDSRHINGQAIFQPETEVPCFPYATKFGGYYVYNKYYIIGRSDNEGNYLLCSFDGYTSDASLDKTFLNLLINIFTFCGISFNGNIFARDQKIFHNELVKNNKILISK